MKIVSVLLILEFSVLELRTGFPALLPGRSPSSPDLCALYPNMEGEGLGDPVACNDIW